MVAEALTNNKIEYVTASSGWILQLGPIFISTKQQSVNKVQGRVCPSFYLFCLNMCHLSAYLKYITFIYYQLFFSVLYEGVWKKFLCGIFPRNMAWQRCALLSFLLSRLDGWWAIWPFYRETVVYIVMY